MPFNVPAANWKDYQILMIVLGDNANRQRTTIMVHTDSLPDPPFTVDYDVFVDQTDPTTTRSLEFQGASSGENRTTASQIRMSAANLRWRTNIFALYGWKY